jgi:hypothetical protein
MRVVILVNENGNFGPAQFNITKWFFVLPKPILLNHNIPILKASVLDPLPLEKWFINKHQVIGAI